MEFQFCLVFLVLLTGFPSIQSQTDSELSRLESTYYQKCLRHTGNEEAFNKLRSDVYETNAYFESAFLMLPDRKKEFCKEPRKNLEYRIQRIGDDLKACLGQEEKFLGDFLKESFGEFLHFWCHNEGENTIKFFSQESSKCRQDIENSKSNDLDNCLNRIFPPTKSFLTKSELCDDITVTKKCFTTLVNAHCPTAYNLKELTGTFFSYVSKPCSGCANAMNFVVLSGLLVFHWFLN